MWGGLWLAHFAVQHHQHNGTNELFPFYRFCQKSLWLPVTLTHLNQFQYHCHVEIRRNQMVTVVEKQLCLILIFQLQELNISYQYIIHWWYLIIFISWKPKASTSPFQSSHLCIHLYVGFTLVMKYHCPLNYKIKHCSCFQFYPGGRQEIPKLGVLLGSQP